MIFNKLKSIKSRRSFGERRLYFRRILLSSIMVAVALTLYGVLMYRVALPAPMRFTLPVFTIAPKTASTVVGLTSGRILHISALERGVRLFKIVASTRAFFVIFLPCTTANPLSSSL